MDNAFTYLEKNKAELESDYPYKGVGGTCVYEEDDGKFNVISFTDVAANNVD